MTVTPYCDHGGCDRPATAFRWTRDGEPIEGAVEITYVLTLEDINKAINGSRRCDEHADHEPEQCGDCGEVILGGHGHCSGRTT